MDFLKIGYIRKPHGIKGEVKVSPLTDEVDRYLELSNIYILKANQYLKEEIESIKNGVDCLILKFKNSNSRDDAEKFRELYIYIKKEDGVPLEEDEYYTQDLGECTLLYDSRVIGKVKNILNTGSCDILVVIYNDKEVLFPFLKKYIEKVDIKNREIHINQFEGFFD